MKRSPSSLPGLLILGQEQADNGPSRVRQYTACIFDKCVLKGTTSFYDSDFGTPTVYIRAHLVGKKRKVDIVIRVTSIERGKNTLHGSSVPSSTNAAGLQEVWSEGVLKNLSSLALSKLARWFITLLNRNKWTLIRLKIQVFGTDLPYKLHRNTNYTQFLCTNLSAVRGDAVGRGSSSSNPISLDVESFPKPAFVPRRNTSSFLCLKSDQLSVQPEPHKASCISMDGSVPEAAYPVIAVLVPKTIRKRERDGNRVRCNVLLGRGGREIARNWLEFVSFNWQRAPRPPTILPSSSSAQPQFRLSPFSTSHCDNNYSYSLFYKLTLPTPPTAEETASAGGLEILHIHSINRFPCFGFSGILSGRNDEGEEVSLGWGYELAIGAAGIGVLRGEDRFEGEE
ncbi:hypothetical protein WN48_06633 [Eufriesea mexicana]|uniref:Uncharacterized protein n=1 Tax=Eufriesea mexicana TaxID=516756 RepID=A0A310STV2_9HYME|nr:hypothetical protein WN48_06633 [Eufriesea mexicana]